MKRNILKNKLYNFIKKVLVITIITTNIFCYLPVVSFAVDEIDKRYPATVPGVADEIISKYVNTKKNGDSGTSNGYGVISTYEESGDGWDTITKVEYPNGTTRTYRNYLQWKGSYQGEPFWDNVIATDGCGPTCVATVLSGYGYDVNPKDVVDNMTTKRGDSLSYLIEPLKTIGNIEAVDRRFSDKNAKKEIQESLENARPVIANYPGHYIVCLGIDSNGHLIYSDPGYSGREAEYGLTIDELVNNCSRMGYILITSDSNAKTPSKTSNNKNNSNKKSSSSSTGNGQASTTKCELTNGGYDAIFTSGTTGRQFKEYKQNIPGWGSKYKISHLPGTNGDWDGECGLVSTMIVGSGYSEKATFEDATNKMKNADGWTSIPTWTGDYTGQSVSFVGYDSNEMVDKLSKGCVAIIHGTSSYVSSGGTHYMAILDIKPDKSQVYLSNPWNGSKYQGWISVETIDDYFGADIIAYVTNDGSIVNYDGGGSIVTTLDNFLFIGDSRTAAIESDLAKLGNNITAIGVSSSKPSDWEQTTKTGKGTVLGRSVKLPLKSGIKGVSVALGVNDTNETNSMKNVLNNLLERYPDTPIFVNSVFYVGSGYSYGVLLDADKMNSNIDQFNAEMKEFCNNNSNLIYIDITNDLYESNYLKSTYTNDNLHLNYEGNKILVENIKNAILGSGKLNNNTINMSKNIVENGRGGYKIDINLDEEVETMLERLEEEDYDIEKYLKGWFKKKRLKNMIKAAIVTQYPDLRSADEIASDAPIPTDIPMLPDEVQGCVKIKRYTDEETKNSFVAASLTNPIDKKDENKGMYLSYKPYDEFTKMITDGDAAAMNYFSMDSSNNIVVAGWETMEVHFEQPVQEGSNPPGYDAPRYYTENVEPIQEPYSKLTTKSINYLDQISGYDMPFSLLWTLLVYGNDQAFVSDLAELVIDTEIVIGCYDATTVNVVKTDIEYTGKTTEEISIPVTQTNDNPDHSSDKTTKEITIEYYFKVKEVDTRRTDNPTLKVNYANTWTAEYIREYKQEKKDTEVSDPSISESDDKITIDQNIYQKVDDHYSGDRKPDDEILDEVDKTISTEADKALSDNLEKGTKEANDYNKKFQYRYDALNSVINQKHWDSDLEKIMKNKDIQNLMINMLISGTTSVEQIKSVFNEENELVVKRVEENTANASRKKEILQLRLGTMSMLQSAVDQVINSENMYNKVTKNGSDTERNKTYNATITSISISEYKQIVYKKETVTEETTETEVKEIPINNNVRWKVDKNAKENSFVKLLYYSKFAKKNLDSLEFWFFDSMEETAAIADLVDLMKFLFQCTYNQDYGIDEDKIEELKDLFDPTKMKSTTRRGNIVGGASYASLTIPEDEMQVLYKLVQAEGGAGTHEQMMYITCTILNRMLSSAFAGDTVSEIAFAPNQFEVTWNGMYDAAIPTAETIAAVDDALQTGDTTGGAIGFQNDWLYDQQYPGQTYETPIELLRETWPSGSVVVFFTTASIQAELAQY